ncbi:MAG TPA: amidase [Solirubrobacterales bacterium]|nr:amidase [Solirubrobacterales bacterium]
MTTSAKDRLTAPFDVVEAGIPAIREALETGEVTSVELVHEYLRRIARFDRQGIRLNAVPVLNPGALAEAAASDVRRAEGKSLGPLDGIPYTAKDSYKVKGLTVAAGSPAFEDLIAGDDAFTIGRLRASGAVLIGLTNMPPMAAGGMQRGVYGRAESPYNGDYLTAAFGSGSSNGSGTATAASFAAFGLGEETWSSGRAPASNNALVAYTPSRGVISMRGNWPLYAAMDVVVPHARTVEDLLEVLDVVVADDPEARGDFWRVQTQVEIPRASEVRPARYTDLKRDGSLKGKRFGIPRMYINLDPESAEPIETRPSVITLWQKARKDLEARGAEIVEVDFPAVSNYENDRPGAESMYRRGLVPPEFLEIEMWELIIWSWNDFLDQNGDPGMRSLDDVDGPRVFPQPPGTLPDRYPDDADLADLVARGQGVRTSLEDIPYVAESLAGLEQTRQVDFEQWLDREGLDGVVFPAAADVAPQDAESDPAANEIAWRNGVRYSNGNLAIRHLGIPTVTVPMGLMEDIGMPVGLTFAGRAYDDSALLSYAREFERAGPHRVPPPRTPALGSPGPSQVVTVDGAGSGSPLALEIEASLEPGRDEGPVHLNVTVRAEGPEPIEITVFADGTPLDPVAEGSMARAGTELAAGEHEVVHSVWRAPYGSLVSALGVDASGRWAAAQTVAGGIG